MFSKANKKERIDPDQKALYEHAHARIKQKKRLMWHFIVFLIGSVFLIIINPILGIGNEFFIKDWFVWAILIWAFLFFIHLFNVFVMKRFMGKEWESAQLDKLRAKQEKRIAQLEQKVEKELPLPNEAAQESDIKKNDTPHQTPPEIE